LRDDLDWIVMKCLEKDRTRRFATANALAEDIGRLPRRPAGPGDAAEQELPAQEVRRAQPCVGRRRRSGRSGAVGGGGSVARIRASAKRGSARRRSDAKARAEIAEAAEKTRADELAQVARFQQEQLASIDVEAFGARLRTSLLAPGRVRPRRKT